MGPYERGQDTASYIEAKGTAANPFFSGTEVRAHEFHYYGTEVKGKYDKGYDLRRGTGTGDGKDGFAVNNMLCTFMHMHSLSIKDRAGNLIGVCENDRR